MHQEMIFTTPIVNQMYKIMAVLAVIGIGGIFPTKGFLRNIFNKTHASLLAYGSHSDSRIQFYTNA